MSEVFYDGRQDDESTLDNLESVPDGDYPTLVKKCEIKFAKDNANVSMYAFEIEICAGEHQGRLLFANYIFRHHNEKAVNIGRARMKQICVSVTGKEGVRSEQDLYDKPFICRVKTKTKGGNTRTEIIKTGPSSGIVDKRKNGSAEMHAGNMNQGVEDQVPF